MKSWSIRLSTVMLVAITAAALEAAPVGTAITYQGQLKNNGSPASGPFTMMFTLWDDPGTGSPPVGGSQVGAALVFDGLGGNPPPVDVVNGLFTATLDFGASAFNGSGRWLQIAVDGTTLSPRQPLTPAPYAVHALSAPRGYALDAADGNPTEALSIDNIGNAAIATNRFFGINPADTFTYDGKSIGHYSLGWYSDTWNANGGTAWLSAFGGFKAFTSAAPRLALTQAGNVGIGTMNPQTQLHLTGNVRADGGQYQSWGPIELRPDIDNSGDDVVRFLSGDGAENMRIDPVGNVGIGTTSPNNRLSIAGGLTVDRGAANDGASLQNAIRLGADTSGEGIASKRTAGGNQFGLDFFTASQPRMSIRSNGNVGIGTTSPAQMLSVSGTIESISGGFKFPDGTVQTTAAAGTGSLWAPNGSFIYNTNAGNVGIGTSLPNATLHVNGSMAVGAGPPQPGYSLAAKGSTIIERDGAAFLDLDVNATSTRNAMRMGWDGSWWYVENLDAGLPGRKIRLTANGPGQSVDAATQFDVLDMNGNWQVSAYTSNEAVIGEVGWLEADYLAAPGKLFKIDHPLDPANKFLFHSCVESPDMKNIYDGVITTDAGGYATIGLPDYFQALNRDFRYQLTVVDSNDSDEFVLAKVVREVANNRFTIRTSRPGVKVSWQVTGIRHDAFAETMRVQPEVEKTGAERGRYMHPTLFGQSEEMSIGAIGKDRPHQEQAEDQ